MKKYLPAKITVILIIICLFSSCLTGCGQGKNPSAEKKEETKKTVTVTDAKGNKVDVPADLKKIAVTPLPWSSVIYSIDGTSKRMVSINPGAMGAYKGRFLEQLDKNYGKLDTGTIGKDFSINIEKLVADKVQACVIWDYQTAEAKKLKDVGIAPIMVNNKNIEQLEKSIRAIGQLLGKEQRAKMFIDAYENTYKKIDSYKDKVKNASKPKVLYLRSSDLKLQGNDHFIKQALKMAGAHIISENATDITMEEIIKENPDIILLSNFDPFMPGDLYGNKLPGQDWSTVKAVKDKRVYKVPLGIYRWDAPGVETPLMMMWLAQLIQPEIFKDIHMDKEVPAFFKKYFHIELSKKDMEKIMQKEANKFSSKTPGIS